MANETRTSSFPSTQRDIFQLKQTATDAVNDLGSTALVHASKAHGQLRDLAGHLQEEGGDQINQVKGRLNDLVGSARNYVSERPLTCIGAALVAGFLIGLSRRNSCD